MAIRKNPGARKIRQGCLNCRAAAAGRPTGVDQTTMTPRMGVILNGPVTLDD